MALQVSYTYRGLTAPMAYLRLIVYQVVKGNQYAQFSVAVHADAARRSVAPLEWVDVIQYVVQDTASVLNPDGSVLTPARTSYTDLFSDAVLQLAGRSPEKACYAYLRSQYPSGVDV